MRPAIHDATARQDSGEPLSSVSQAGDRSNGRLDMAAEGEIAGLADRPTHELRLAWRKVYRRESPVGLSRDLVIRALANKLQERAYGGPSASMKRHLNTLAGEFEKGSLCLDPGVVLKTGARLVRQWRGPRPHCSRARGRVRVRRPALSLTDHDCRADYRRTLVGPSVLRSDQANLPFAIHRRRARR